MENLTRHVFLARKKTSQWDVSFTYPKPNILLQKVIKINGSYSMDRLHPIVSNEWVYRSFTVCVNGHSFVWGLSPYLKKTSYTRIVVHTYHKSKFDLIFCDQSQGFLFYLLRTTITIFSQKDIAQQWPDKVSEKIIFSWRSSSALESFHMERLIKTSMG